MNTELLSVTLDFLTNCKCLNRDIIAFLSSRIFVKIKKIEVRNSAPSNYERFN